MGDARRRRPLAADRDRRRARSAPPPNCSLVPSPSRTCSRGAAEARRPARWRSSPISPPRWARRAGDRRQGRAWRRASGVVAQAASRSRAAAVRKMTHRRVLWRRGRRAGKLVEPRGAAARRARFPLPARTIHDQAPPRRALHRQCHRRCHRRRRRRLPRRAGARQGLDAADRRGRGGAALRRMGPGREVSGGSAGNTAAGLAALGIRAGFIGQVADDQLGKIYQHDIEAQGIDFLVPARGDVGATARCLILVTPDAQRTMNTFLGAAQRLERERRRPGARRRRRRSSTSKAICGTRPSRARRWRRRSTPPAPPGARSPSPCPTASASTATATASWQLIDDGRIDILFANEAEITALAGEPTTSTRRSPRSRPRSRRWSSPAARRARSPCRGDERAEVPAEPIERLVDTTGAGDLFAAGFLAGQARGLGARSVAQARRDRRRRSHPALWRAAGEGSEGAGGRLARLTPAGKRKGGPDRSGPPFFVAACPLSARGRGRRCPGRAGRGRATSSSWTSTRPWPRWLWRRL